MSTTRRQPACEHWRAYVWLFGAGGTRLRKPPPPPTTTNARRRVRACARAPPTNARARATLGVSVAAAAVLSSVVTALTCLVGICCCAPYFFPREHADEEAPRTSAASLAHATQQTHQRQPVQPVQPVQQQGQQPQPHPQQRLQQPPPPGQASQSQPSLAHEARPLPAPLARRPAPVRGPPASFSHPQYMLNTGSAAEVLAAQLRTLAAASTPQPARSRVAAPPRMLPAPEASVDRKTR